MKKIINNTHTVIVIEGVVDEGFVFTEENIKGMLVGDLLTIGVGNYDRQKDNVEVSTVVLGKHDLLTRQHLVVGKHIHDRHVESRKSKESE